MKLADPDGYLERESRIVQFPDPNSEGIAPAADIVTEDFAAYKFAELHAGRLRFCHGTGAWFEWNGAAWRQIRTALPFQWARELARKLSRTESAKVRYVTSRTSFAAGVERFCRSDPVFAVTADYWDRDPWLLGPPGGTVDLRTGLLRPSDPCDGITKLTAVEPASRVDCPRWLTFLDEVTGGEADLVRFLQLWSGYCLTADTREHALVFVYGPGGNGKSVFLNALTKILQNYAATAAMETFTASTAEKHPTDLAMLRGARLVTSSETEEGRAWAETRIKQMTGGDPISARFMRRDFFTYQPTFKLTIIGNNKPVLRNVDEAARRRINVVPFVRKPVAPDCQLEEKLKAEWCGILRWAIEGCLDWQVNGLVRPASVVAATEEYFAGQDITGEWLDTHCVVDPANPYRKATTQDLFDSWSSFARTNNEPIGSVRTFAETLIKRGFPPVKNVPTATGTRVRGFSGVELRYDPTRGAPDE
jgi:putative DNA primase/helicase